MRSFWVLFVAFLATVLPAGAAVIGGPLLRDGLEVVPSTLGGAELDRPAAMSRAADSVFLMADVHAARDEGHGFAEHAFIPYLSISYALTKEDAPTFKKAGLLYPVAAKDGPRYGASVEMAGPGTYHLIYIISPPSAHGMMRRTDKAGGVPDWFKPITGNWDFVYAGQTK